MLSKNQEKLIKSLQTKKGRQKSGLCLVEGEKNIKSTKKFIDFTFSPKDTPNFKKLVTTETPQTLAAVAKTPQFDLKEILIKKVIVVLDNVQDPGNLGTIIRLCLGFEAGLILHQSADPTNPKVIRSSAGAIFQTPWITSTEQEIKEVIKQNKLPVYRLENKKTAKDFGKNKFEKQIVLLAGSEGQGIKIKIKGTSLKINHNKELESLNVANALAISLHHLY